MFTYYQFDEGQVRPQEFLPGKAGEVFQVGEMLSVGADGGLTKCAATDTPAYLCLGATQTDGTVPCSRVVRSVIYDVPLSAAGTALKLGNKVTLGADALTVTATTASGVAELVRMDGTAAGDTVGVRFAV